MVLGLIDSGATRRPRSADVASCVLHSLLLPPSCQGDANDIIC